jgi:catechol 2,3-dioxygenase-like lactoylglutathione lyase family enzyme
MNVITGKFHVCINTCNFAKSVAFYQALGFTDEGQVGIQTDTSRMQYLIHHQSGAIVEISQDLEPSAKTVSIRERKDIPGLNHFGFQVSDLSTIRNLLLNLGAPIIEGASTELYDYLFARGPDNELIGFAQFKQSQIQD